MEVTFLGTGTSGGVPMAGCFTGVCASDDSRDQRLRSSILIEEGNTKLIIDCSPDFRQQTLRERIERIDAIVFTHSHRDHTGGLDDIRGYNFAMKRAMPLYMHDETHDLLKQQYDYVFGENLYPGGPRAEVNIFDSKPFQINDVRLTPIEVVHYKMRVYAFRIKDFTYITDANYINPEEMEKIKGSKVVVINALRREPHRSHYTLEQALKVIEELKPETAYLTHMSYQMGFHKEVSEELPDHVFLAYDGLKLNLP